MKKRDPIKHVRDRAKSRYLKGSACEICGVADSLDFHHYHSMTPLFNKWLRSNKLTANTDEEVLAIRDQFIEDHAVEVFDETVTLCHPHHLKLHGVYGKDPPLATAAKQKNWVRIQREKYGLV